MLEKINFNAILIILFSLVCLTPLQLSYADYDDSFTVNIPNSQGGYTAVVVKRSGEGYVGPQGEYYTEFPKVSQLQAMYAIGAPGPTVIPYNTYVEPQEQPPVNTQVIYQVQTEDRGQDYNDHPPMGPGEDRDQYYNDHPPMGHDVVEVEASDKPKEDDNIFKIFDKKKKKSKSGPAPAPAKTPSPPPADKPQSPPAQKPKDDSKGAPKTKPAGSPDDKSASWHKDGTPSS